MSHLELAETFSGSGLGGDLENIVPHSLAQRTALAHGDHVSNGNIPAGTQ